MFERRSLLIILGAAFMLVGLQVSALSLDQHQAQKTNQDQFPKTEHPGMTYYLTYASSEFH